MKKNSENKIRNLANNGKNYDQIMTITGLSRYHIRKILGAKYKERIDPTKPTGSEAEIYTLANNGKSYPQIMAATGLSRYYIDKILGAVHEKPIDSTKQEIIDLFCTDQSVSQISDCYNIPKWQIYKIWRQARLSTQNRKLTLVVLDPFMDEIHSLNESSKSYLQIMKITGLSRYYIEKVLGKIGRTIIDQKKQKIIDMFYTDQSVHQIEDYLNISRTHIYKTWKKHGLSLKDRNQFRHEKQVLNILDPLTGKIFGSWKILQKVWVNTMTKEYSHNKYSIDRQERSISTFYECKCLKCNNTVKAIRRNSLVTGSSKSCGHCAMANRTKL